MPKAIGASGRSRPSTGSGCFSLPSNSIAHRLTARNWTIPMSEIATVDNFERSVADAEKLFELAAEARAEAENADERRKQIEALMFIKHKDAGCSAAEADKRAKADPEYRQAA